MSDYKLTRPCKSCPFLRAKGGLRGLLPERLEGIVVSDGGFVCHRTHSSTSDAEKPDPQECAGFLIFNLVNESAPQMMRISGRLGFIDENALLESEHLVFTDLDEIIEAHESFSIEDQAGTGPFVFRGRRRNAR